VGDDVVLLTDELGEVEAKPGRFNSRITRMGGIVDDASLVEHKVGGLPVMEGGKLVGIITAIDMLRAFGEVLGTAEEGVSRIDLAFSGTSFDLVTIAELIGASGGEVLGGSYEGAEDRKDQIVYVPVRIEDARRTADMLTDQGFSVIAIHQ
jgi:acetoin utilization protein AcuB